MEIYLAKTQGFCAGVSFAIDIVEQALRKYGAPLYVYHEIVHNTYVVNDFRNRGVIFVENLNDVPQGRRVIFSAHGVPPSVIQTAKERKLKYVDATCPLVTKVHNEATKFSRLHQAIVLIGHKGHQELIGTAGYVDPELLYIVENEDDIESLDIDPDTEVAYITQTTLSVDDANRIIDRLRARFPQLEGPPKDDICYATQNRQEAVGLLSSEADAVIVLGSQNSSNSQRLRELARERGVPSYLIDGAADIDPAWFTGDETVVVTAGASAPESVVQECLEWLRDRYGASIEARSIRDEEVHFPLPRELRNLPPIVATS